MSTIKSENFHVAIVGAGIAGLALAIGLAKQDIPFTLYEEAAQYSTVGAGIGFGPNGLLAMDMLEPGFRPRYEAVCVGNRDSKDQHVFFEGLLCREGLGKDQSWYGNSSWGSPKYTRKSAHRKELLEILTAFIPDGRVRFSKKLVKLDQQDDDVSLRFADGETARADIVVGADGIDSAVRQHILQERFPDQVEPIYAGSYAYRAVIPMAEAKKILGDLTDTAKMYCGHLRNITTYRVSGGEEFNFLHCFCDPARPWMGTNNSMIQEVTFKEMLADFEGLGFDERLLRLLKKAKPMRWGLFHHLHTSTYTKGRVVLIGDAAHASLPHQAAGAGQGVEDAAVLAQLLGIGHRTTSTEARRAILSSALEAYDSVRRPRAQRQAEQSLDALRLVTFQDERAGDDMLKVLERMQGDRFEWLWFHDLQQDVDRARKRMVARS